MLQASNEKCEAQLVLQETEGEINPVYLQTHTADSAGPGRACSSRHGPAAPNARHPPPFPSASPGRASSASGGKRFPFFSPTRNPFSGYRQVPGLLVANQRRLKSQICLPTRSGSGAGNLQRVIDAITALQRAAGSGRRAVGHGTAPSPWPCSARAGCHRRSRFGLKRPRACRPLSLSFSPPAAAFLPAREVVPGCASAGAARLCPSGLGALGLGWDRAPSSTAKAAPAPAGPHPSCRGHANPLGEHREERERPSSALGSEPSAALPGR